MCISLTWKNKKLINYGNRIAVKTLQYIEEEFVKFSA